MDYNPQNLEQRLADAGKTLQSELENSQAVQSAKTDYENAKAALELAESHKAAWPGNASKSKLAEWHACVNDIASRKVFLAQAETNYRKALNDAASARYAARL